jgi:hypothetical protein
MSTPDIHDLFQQVRDHPDFVFGTIFVTADFPSEQAAEQARDTHWDKAFENQLVETGNSLISDEFGTAQDLEILNDSPRGEQ